MKKTVCILLVVLMAFGFILTSCNDAGDESKAETSNVPTAYVPHLGETDKYNGKELVILASGAVVGAEAAAEFIPCPKPAFQDQAVLFPLPGDPRRQEGSAQNYDLIHRIFPFPNAKPGKRSPGFCFYLWPSRM